MKLIVRDRCGVCVEQPGEQGVIHHDRLAQRQWEVSVAVLDVCRRSLRGIRQTHGPSGAGALSFYAASPLGQ